MSAAVRFFGVDNLRGMDNLRGFTTDAARRAIDEHGEDPCTCAQTAAHEAGHVVVAWAFGETVRSARITPHRICGRTRWLGRNERTGYPGEDTPSLVPGLPVLAHAAAVNLAGFIGEDLVGLSHPASSLDERSKAKALCERADDTAGVPPGTYAAAVTRGVLDLLTLNRRQFDAIRGHLVQRRVLTAKEAARMLAGGYRIEKGDVDDEQK